MAIIKDTSAYTQNGNGGGITFQLDNGSLIRAGESFAGARGIKKSTDGGQTWVSKYTYATSTFDTRLTFIDSRGYIYVGTIHTTVPGKLLRSTDQGETWSIVSTSEASGWWYMCENPITGYMYANEYSVGNRDANELYAYNIWRSTDNGATWVKFYTCTTQSAPGALDGTRHIHGIWCDSAGRMYIGFGDPTFAGEATKAYRFFDNGASGSLGVTISTTDNGFTAFAETETGALLFGGDNSPVKVKAYNPSNDTMTTKLDLGTEYGSYFNTAILSMVRGKHGVIYALLNGNTPTKPSAVAASGDDGDTWTLLKFLVDGDIRAGSYLNVNRNVANSQIYIGMSQSASTPYMTIPDYTRGEILNKRVVVR